jgi:hypothetical protein
MISLKEVENIQKDWGANLVKLGSLKGSFEACENEAYPNDKKTLWIR